MSDLIQKQEVCPVPDIPPTTALADEAQEPVPPQPSETLEAAP